MTSLEVLGGGTMSFYNSAECHWSCGGNHFFMKSAIDQRLRAGQLSILKVHEDRKSSKVDQLSSSGRQVTYQDVGNEEGCQSIPDLGFYSLQESKHERGDRHPLMIQDVDVLDNFIAPRLFGPDVH